MKLRRSQRVDGMALSNTGIRLIEQYFQNIDISVEPCCVAQSPDFKH